MIGWVKGRMLAALVGMSFVLVACGGGGSDSGAAPVANAGAAQTVPIKTTVTLDGSSSTAGSGTISYAWSLTSKPGGSSAALSSATTAQPTFAPDVAGAYVFSLTVSNGSSTSDPATVTITASSDTPPVASAGTAQSVVVGQTVVLDGSKSSDSNGHTLTFAWTLVTVPSGSAAALSLSTSVNPSFVPDTAGTYVATLVVSDGTFKSAAASVSVVATVGNAPPVAKAGSAQSAVAGMVITLDGSKSSDANGDKLTYAWTLTTKPSGSAAALTGATTANPSFTADIGGSYVATLVVNDGHASSLPSTVTITVAASGGNVAPVANAGPDQSALLLKPVTLDGSKSTDANGDKLTYAWTFTSVPSGSTAALSLATSAAPTFIPDLAGTYVVQLIVNDGKLNSTPDTVTITSAATNVAPVANAGADLKVKKGSVVHLDGSNSTDANGDPITYAWTFTALPAGSSASLSDPTSPTPTFTADVAGSYVLSLVVNDGKLSSAPDTVTVTSVTANLPPVADAGPNQNVAVGATVILDGSGSSDPDGNTITYLWSFVSAPDGSTATLSSTTVVNPKFVADLAGTYVVNLVVNDGKANSTAATVLITATAGDTPPVANAGAVQNVIAGTTVVTLNGAGSSDADGNPLTYAWTLSSKPAGSTATLTNPKTVNPTFVADLPGAYVASLVVNDGHVTSAPSSTKVNAGLAFSGQIAASTTWSKTAAPFYVLQGNLTIPIGVTLTIDSGVLVVGNGLQMLVSGTLQVNGTASDLVSLTNLFIVPNGKVTSNHLIDIVGAVISGGGVYVEQLNVNYGSLILTDSQISDTTEPIYLGFPAGTNVIERNVFTNAAGILYLLQQITPPPPIPLTLSIQNNSFSNWTGGYAIANQQMFGSPPVTIAKNSFLTTTLTAVELIPDFFPVAMDASNNYWGTTDPTVILGMIHDAHNDPHSSGTITYQPFLTAPDPATPTP